MPALAAILPAASTLATVAGIGGAAISGLGAISSGISQQHMASYQAQVAANNAITAQQNANYATAAGEQAATIQGLKERQTAGAVRAGLAASGMDVNTGSPEKVQQTQAETGVEDVETVRQRTALEAYGYRTQATGFTAQQGLEQAQASYAVPAGITTAAGDLLTGVAKFGPGGAGASGTGADANAPFSPENQQLLEDYIKTS